MAAVAARFTPRAWLLFGAMSLIWGMPYLFIKQAVDSYSPASVVAGRTLIGALLLLPFALRSGALRPAWRKIGWVLLFGAVEMAGPFLLLGHKSGSSSVVMTSKSCTPRALPTSFASSPSSHPTLLPRHLKIQSLLALSTKLPTIPGRC